MSRSLIAFQLKKECHLITINELKKIISEANSMVHVSSDTMGLETSDGVRDNDSFDGLYDAVTVPLQET